jgi:hypothetical protein
MRGDPKQFFNVVDRPRYRPLVGTLAAELDRLRTCQGASCAAPLPRSLWTNDPVPAVTFDPAA